MLLAVKKAVGKVAQFHEEIASGKTKSSQPERSDYLATFDNLSVLLKPKETWAERYKKVKDQYEDESILETTYMGLLAIHL